MTRKEFIEIIKDYDRAQVLYLITGDGLNVVLDKYQQLLNWFDWAQPLIELGIQAQQAQEQAQQD